MSGRLSFDYVRQRYGVPAKRGMRVTVDGKPGRITSGAGHYIRVRFDGETFSSFCHPTWRVVYHEMKAQLASRTSQRPAVGQETQSGRGDSNPRPPAPKAQGHTTEPA